jgi:hypothetical protein
VATALPIIAVALLLLSLRSCSNFSRDADRRADLEVAADLRAIGDALQASSPQQRVTDDRVRRLVYDAVLLAPDRVVAVHRPPGGIAVTIRLTRQVASPFGGPDTTEVCAEIALDNLGRADPTRRQSGPRPCRPEELAPPTTISAGTR